MLRAARSSDRPSRSSDTSHNRLAISGSRAHSSTPVGVVAQAGVVRHRVGLDSVV